MIDLKQFTPQAMAVIRPLLAVQQYRSCDYSIGGIYMWREFFNLRYTVEDNMLICTADYFEDGFSYSVPVGTGSFTEALESIRQDSVERSVPLRFCCVTEKGLEQLKEVFGEPKSVKAYRDWADYVYPYDNFLGYHGKKLVTPRNHCNRFLRDYPQFTYVPITKQNLLVAKKFLAEKSESLKKTSPIAIEDYLRAVEIMDHFEAFGFIGGILSVDGRTVGVTAGEIIGDTMYVQIEKALPEYSGSYPMLAQLFAKQAASPEVSFINREDDSGDEGLRHSKLEYRPCELIMKHTVEF